MGEGSVSSDARHLPPFHEKPELLPLTRVGIACYTITYPNILICKGNLNGNPA
jgi:hypothetical protein